MNSLYHRHPVQMDSTSTSPRTIFLLYSYPHRWSLLCGYVTTPSAGCTSQVTALALLNGSYCKRCRWSCIICNCAALLVTPLEPSLSWPSIKAPPPCVASCATAAPTLSATSLHGTPRWLSQLCLGYLSKIQEKCWFPGKGSHGKVLVSLRCWQSIWLEVKQTTSPHAGLLRSSKSSLSDAPCLPWTLQFCW